MKITRPPENSTVCRGSRVIISCGYNSTTPLPVTWIINGTSFTQQEIENNSLMYRLNSATTPNALTLTIWSINDNITIQCIVNSTLNIISTPGTATVIAGTYVSIRVETGFSHLIYTGHALSRSTESDPIYKIPGSDPDFALDHVC